MKVNINFIKFVTDQNKHVIDINPLIIRLEIGGEARGELASTMI